MLHGEPLRLSETEETAIDHPAWGLRCAQKGGRLHIDWRPLHKLDGLQCRLERVGATTDEYQACYNATRTWSPFNYELTARKNRDGQVVGVSFGKAVTLRNDGSTQSAPASPEQRQRILIELIGLSEEIVSQLPADIPTPPPPGSRTPQASP